jgi:hypothetical protein
MMIATVDYKNKYEQALSALDTAQLKIATLQHELSQLKKMIFGSRQERFVPTGDGEAAQLQLDIEAEQIAAPLVTGTKKIEYTRITTSTELIQHPGRMKLPEHLRREEVIIEPEQTTAGCKKIGEEITEQLDYQPGELYVRK